MIGPGDFGDLYSQIQQIFLVVFAVVGAFVAAYKTVRSRIKKKRAGRHHPDAVDDDGDPIVRLPSDGLTRDHPDPVVRRLESQLRSMDARFAVLTRQLEESDAHEEDNRRTILAMVAENREKDDIVYVLRRVVRRLLDGWPSDGHPPQLTQHEWDVVGIDEDTMSGPPRRINNPHPAIPAPEEY